MGNKKKILITGATSGVGKAAAFALAKPENHLILVARNMQKGEQLKAEILRQKPAASVDVLYADLALINHNRGLVAGFKKQYDGLDVLINCAGLVSSKRIETAEGIEQTLAVNYLSHYLLSTMLFDELQKSQQGRIINVASLIPPIAKINFEDFNSVRKYNGVMAYLQSKVADVMFTYDFAEQIKDTKVTINAVHPGVVKTNLGAETSSGLLAFFVKFSDKFVAITPEKSAERIVYLATDEALSDVSGKYFKGEKKPASTNSFSYDPENRQKLAVLTKMMIENKSPKEGQQVH